MLARIRLCIVCRLFPLQFLFPLRTLTSVKHYIAELAKMAILKGSWLFHYFLFDICMEVHYQLAWAKVSNFPRSPKFCSINFETFTINDSLLPSTSPPELAALQLISACSGISNPFFPQIMWFWVCHGVAHRTLQWGKCFLAITRTELRCTLINCGQSYNKLLMRSLLTYRRLYVHSRVFSFLVRLVQKKIFKNSDHSSKARPLSVINDCMCCKVCNCLTKAKWSIHSCVWQSN